MMASISGQVKSGTRGALALYLLRIGFFIYSALNVIGSEAYSVGKFLNQVVAMLNTLLEIGGGHRTHRDTL